MGAALRSARHADHPMALRLGFHELAIQPLFTTSKPSPPAENYEETCAFTDFANWLIPGRLMLGRYPFVEPSRCRSRDVGEEQLRQLLAAGITVFVSLQVGTAHPWRSRGRAR